ncbi:MAG: O-phosphoserine--tRNA ligase [Candidatus Altiarchaeota archaeon]
MAAKSVSGGREKVNGSKGSTHPIHDLVQKVREVFVGLGFDEVENPVFLPEDDVYKQYGSEAPVILDRVYYLAGLPRPDIGLSQDKISDLRKVSASIDVETLKQILREYREGAVEGDNLLETMVGRLKIKTDEAAKIIDLFPEFRSLKPVPEKMTLRSHMTGAWFPTIAALRGSRNLPMKLFSIGLRFRREQKVDATHLRAHYGGSMVIVDRKFDLEEGKKITEEILNKLEFGDVRFVQKKATSNYYAPGTEYEVYSGSIEVADIGLYNRESLKKYGIDYDVFNLGFGLERILMVKNNLKDVRELLYPQFYQALELSDKEIAEQITIDRMPVTVEGKKLAEKIRQIASEHANANSPCSYTAFEGSFLGKKIRVNVVEKEDNTRLLGPAALNQVYVHDGGVYGLPDDVSKLKKNVAVVKEKGLKLDFTFLDAISNYFASMVEEAVKAGEREGFYQVKMAKGSADVNVNVGEQARRFIESKNKTISLKGPVFTAVEFTSE